MSRAASRLHTTGSVLFILDGIVHSVGQYTSGASDAATRALEASMKASTIPGTPFTYWNIMQGWGALYGGGTIVFGALLLVAARAARGESRVIRATAWVGAVAALFQAAVCLVYRTSPPIFFMVPAALVLAIAGGLARKPAA